MVMMKEASGSATMKDLIISAVTEFLQKEENQNFLYSPILGSTIHLSKAEVFETPFNLIFAFNC